MKKIIFTLLTISFISLGFNSVSAQELKTDNENSNVIIEEISTSSSSRAFFTNPSDTLNGMLYSLNVPTSFYNLNNDSYTANLTEVGHGWLYTNYYFSPNSSGVLFVDYDVRQMNAWSTGMQIGVYDIETRKMVQTFNVNKVPTAACLRISGLNTSHHYAIAFTLYNYSDISARVQGTAVVYH